MFHVTIISLKGSLKDVCVHNFKNFIKFLKNTNINFILLRTFYVTLSEFSIF